MRATRAIAMASAAAIVIAACGSDSDSADETEGTAAAEEAEETEGTEAAEDVSTDDSGDEAAAGDGDCPSELVIQTDWFPELEHGGTYQLIGPDGTADLDTVSYSGPIQEQYAVGGLETITIKTVNFDKTQASVLADGDADMAYITSSDIIQDSGAIPLVGIAKTLDQDPQMLMWDPEQYDIQEPADIAETGAQVWHFPNTSYIEYMLSEGFMTEDQAVPNYSGADGDWVAAEGGIIQHQETDIEVQCLPKDIPEYIEVDMLEVRIGEIIHLSDIALPEGVASVALALGEDHDLAVASIIAPRGGSEDEDEAEAAEAVEGEDAADADGESEDDSED